MRHLFKLGILCLFLSLVGCADKAQIYPANSQQECEACNSSADCADNMYCVGFYNRYGASNRCATARTNSCP